MTNDKGPATAGAPTPDVAAYNHLSKLVNIAAYLVQGGDLPSHYTEDHNRHAPKWLLADIEKADEGLRAAGVKLKSAYDGIRAHIAALELKILQLEIDRNKTKMTNSALGQRAGDD